mmetsp:Transcript_32398/g.80337  ORF Transcript_32398/g.80337 Transcript_32398/m.80337 type:complete len:113 (-) Transcript_32398:264-602(-)
MVQDTTALRKRWLALAQRLTVADGVAERWWRELSDRYSEPGRYYHTLDHLRELLVLSDAHAREIEERDALELAIWFHDIVYASRPTHTHPHPIPQPIPHTHTHTRSLSFSSY